MQSHNGTLIFSATDLSNFLACRHLTLLSRRAALGGPRPRRFDDPSLEVLQQRGIEHEQRFLARLRDGGQRQIADLKSFAEGPVGLERYQRHAQATADAMQAGVDVIYQGFLFDGTWLGYLDFLCKTVSVLAMSWSTLPTRLRRSRPSAGCYFYGRPVYVWWR